jgi:putative ubiquitin-RnfH superfamily antitoxin RatB of RatAB toxin-antitoxin module
MADGAVVGIEIACATPDKQLLLNLDVPVNCTLRQAVLSSGIGAHFPEIDMASALLGIYGQRVDCPEEQMVEVGMRIEVYRPLLADPKEARKRRAAKAAEAASQKT